MSEKLQEKLAQLIETRSELEQLLHDYVVRTQNACPGGDVTGLTVTDIARKQHSMSDMKVATGMILPLKSSYLNLKRVEDLYTGEGSEPEEEEESSESDFIRFDEDENSDL